MATSTKGSPSRHGPSAATGFIGSLALLVAAIVVFAVVMYPKERPAEPAPLASSPAASVSASKRQALRSGQTADSYETSERTPASDVAAGEGVGPSPTEGGRHTVGDAEVQKAIDLIDKGNINDAVAALEAIVKRDPKNETALVELAMINLLDLKQPEQAINYLQKVAEVNPKNQVVMSELVSLYEEENRLDEGLTFLSELHQKDPANTPDIAYGIGEILTMSGRDGEAIPYLERATTSQENGVRAHRELADAYARAGEGDRAIGAYDKAILAQDKEIQEKQQRGLPVSFAVERLNYTKLDKARELLRNGDTEKAQEIVDEVQGQMPNDEAVAAMQDSINRKRAG